MGKISPVSAKYIIHANILVNGVVDKPDVIGAIFGQTEGLLGSDLELRELQRSGRIGRIEVDLQTHMGKSSGTILIPSSLDKAETCVVAAAIEVISRIGPCSAKIDVDQIEDVRITKRTYIVSRAKDLLKNLVSSVLPDSQEITDEVANAVRLMEIREFGKDNLPAGPAIDESDEIIVVEGRADVLNLLKHGIKNVIAMNGSNVSPTIAELSKTKIITAFVDGDRGGILDLKALLMTADVDYVVRAPNGIEVEELTKKQIHQLLRSKISAEQAKLELYPDEDWVVGGDSKVPSYKDSHAGSKKAENSERKEYDHNNKKSNDKNDHKDKKHDQKERYQRSNRYDHEKKDFKHRSDAEEKTEDVKLYSHFKTLLDNLIGTKGAYLLDKELTVMGKVPVSELQETLKNLGTGVHSLVMDGAVNKNLISIAEKMNVSYIVCLEAFSGRSNKVKVLSIDDLQ